MSITSPPSGTGPTAGGTQRAARKAVEELNIEPFIKKHRPSIFNKLEECDHYANSADFNGDMMFIALSLPIANGIIHVASTREHLRKATKWVVDQWKSDANQDPEKISILSALVLIHVAGEGWNKYKRSRDKEKREIWKRIHDRVQVLSTEKLDKPRKSP